MDQEVRPGDEERRQFSYFLSHWAWSYFELRELRRWKRARPPSPKLSARAKPTLIQSL